MLKSQSVSGFQLRPQFLVGGVVRARGDSLCKETKPPLVFTWLTGEAQERSLPIGRAARYGRRSSVSEGPSLSAQLQPLHLVLFKASSAASL